MTLPEIITELKTLAEKLRRSEGDERRRLLKEMGLLLAEADKIEGKASFR